MNKKVEINDDIFEYQYLIVLNFVQSYTYYKVIHDWIAKENVESSFWAKTASNHLCMASIEWCKVFGNYGDNNQYHWHYTLKNISPKDKNYFIKLIETETGLSKEEFKNYHKEFIEFRNQYAAHFEEKSLKSPVPVFKNALEIAFVYDKWVRELIELNGDDFSKVETFKSKASQFKDEVNLIITSSRGFKNV